MAAILIPIREGKFANDFCTKYLSEWTKTAISNSNHGTNFEMLLININ